MVPAMRCAVLSFCILASLFSCSGEKTPETRMESEKHAVFCSPGEPDCLRVLPPVGTYKARVEIQVQALDAPMPPAEPGNWNDPRTSFTQTEDILLVQDARGNLRGERNLGEEDGIHFAKVDSLFCVGFRYEPAICRTPDEQEPATRAAELEHTYGDVLARLGGRLAWKKEKDGWVAMLNENGDESENINKVLSLKGSAAKSEQSGDIRMQLDYELEGQRPDNLRYRLRVHYEHTVSHAAPPVVLPENALHHEGRHRPLMDRKALLGDPIPATLRHLYGRSSNE